MKLESRDKRGVTLKSGKREGSATQKTKKRSDPKVKEMEAEQKRVRYQDTLYKNKETIQNTLQ